MLEPSKQGLGETALVGHGQARTVEGRAGETDGGGPLVNHGRPRTVEGGAEETDG